MHSHKKIRELTNDLRKKQKAYSSLCKRAGIAFKDVSLLETALTHRSYVNENKKSFEHNERLEFLGDAVLGLCISRCLYRDFPEKQEGFLAKIKGTVVSARILADIARHLSLGKYIRLGKGEIATGGRDRDSILADTLEALMGAYFCDAGFKKSSQFIESLFSEYIDRIVEGSIRFSYRTELQELVQKLHKEPPEYRLIEEHGPSNEPVFCMEVFIQGKSFGTGTSTTKKEARQKAAKQALEKIRGR